MASGSGDGRDSQGGDVVLAKEPAYVCHGAVSECQGKGLQPQLAK